MTVAYRALGANGEELVAQWYATHGYEIVARNWRCREGELDIVARKGEVIVFCEVKTRSTDRFGTPVEAITWTKQRRLRRLASAFMAEHRHNSAEVRFDVGSVQGSSLEILESAF